VPSFIPRSLEPYQKRELLAKRLSSLRAAVAAGSSATRVSNAAEKVRSAALALIKAQRSLLPLNLESEALARQVQNLKQEEEQWRALTTEAIVEQFGERPS
jgi:hypothetical protein